ncbi:hypothetical protein [Armatimonas rosea]|uniref:Uncharacterized protein n=1 Tax=Armatimonas rosea TaxID=685828 RepID=A0A7W9SX76_ARMRO|nr:hypothetical protein [Armatimonas rosea]MBB6053889.1 hypothetical protein [Armatimonas rosea]
MLKRLIEDGLVEATGVTTEAGLRRVDVWNGKEPMRASSVETAEANRPPAYGYVFRDLVTGYLCPLYSDSKPLGRDSLTEYVYPLPTRDGTDLLEPTAAAVKAAMTRLEKMRLYAERLSEAEQPSLFVKAAVRDCNGFTEADYRIVGDDDDLSMGQGAEAGMEAHKATSQVRDFTFLGLSDEPETVDAEVLLYALRDNPGHLYATAPFGELGGEWYRTRLLATAQEYHPLKAFLDEQKRMAEEHFAPSDSVIIAFTEIMEEPGNVGTTDDTTLLTAEEPYVDPLAALPNTVRPFWESPLPLPSDDTDLVMAREFWEKAGRVLAKAQTDPDVGGGFFMECQFALEAIAVHLLKQIPERRALARRLGNFYSDFDLRNRIEEMARHFGTPIPFGMVGAARCKSMQKMADGNGISLRDKCVFLLADANERHDAAFRKALMMQTDLLVLLDTVAEIRNEKAHYTSQTESVEAYQNRVIRMTSAAHLALTTLFRVLETQ